MPVRKRRAAEIRRCFSAWWRREIVQAVIAAKPQNGRQTLTVFLRHFFKLLFGPVSPGSRQPQWRAPKECVQTRLMCKTRPFRGATESKESLQWSKVDPRCSPCLRGRFPHLAIESYVLSLKTP